VFIQVDMMTQGDTLFDIVDRGDHAAIESFLLRGNASGGEEELTFFCRMTVSRNFRRQTGYGDHKVLHTPSVSYFKTYRNCIILPTKAQMEFGQESLWQIEDAIRCYLCVTA